MIQTRASRVRRLAATGVGVVALGVGAVSLPGAAQAMPADHPSGSACLPGQARTTGDHVARDPELTTRQVRAFEADLRQRIAAQPRLADPRRAEAPIWIDVAVHSIKERKKGSGVGPKRIDRMIQILNGAFRGAQSDGAISTRFRFRLDSVDWTFNKTWFHATYGTKAQKNMKRALHVGDASTLNLYLNLPGNGEDLLGWATFPEKYAKLPKIDGVVINQDTLLGGPLAPYNLGDTVPHEVGHWLGLYHTFQGRCGVLNDYVTDTPAEATPEFQCHEGRDTCPAKDGTDPVHNFMDYSADPCMNHFTRGQNDRMVLSWRAYRG